MTKTQQNYSKITENIKNKTLHLKRKILIKIIIVFKLYLIWTFLTSKYFTDFSDRFSYDNLIEYYDKARLF